MEDQRTQMTELILNPIHQFKQRLGGYSIWSASTSRTIHPDSGLEHLIVSMQLKKHSEDYTKALDGLRGRTACSRGTRNVRLHGRGPKALEVLEGRLQKRPTPARLDYEEFGGLSGPGQQDCPQVRNILEQGVVHGYALPPLYLPE